MSPIGCWLAAGRCIGKYTVPNGKIISAVKSSIFILNRCDNQSRGKSQVTRNLNNSRWCSTAPETKCQDGGKGYNVEIPAYALALAAYIPHVHIEFSVYTTKIAVPRSALSALLQYMYLSLIRD